jgi:diguanylate cyclase (GGDEF)-like protein
VPRLFHSLRLQVCAGFLAVAAVCVYIGIEASRDELSGAYRDSARTTLKAAAKGFESAHDQSAIREPALLRQELSALMASHPELQSAAVYGPDDDAPLASIGSSGHGAELLVSPIEGGRLAIGYDMRPAQARLDERNRRLAIVFASLAAAALALVGVALGAGVIRPIERLRAAAEAVGAGDLSTRLGWRRRDELGELAREFDAMATYLERKQRRLEELAHRDPLTDLVNHRRFQELLARELDEARASGRPFAVVLLDIDDFKRINELRGHPYGDELLRAAASGLQEAMRDLGVAARMGGDEFALVVPDADLARGFAMAEAARAAVEVSAPVRGALRCSAGVACHPDDGKSADVLLQLARGALRWAKDSGGGRTRRYDPEHVLVVTNEQREDFARVIAEPGVVQPVFQPIASLSSGEVVGYEALARFDGKPGLTPASWFSQAHRLGLGPALEAEAARAALAAPERPPGTFLSINLSPSGLDSERVRELLPGDLSGIVIEITEEERVVDTDALQRSLEPLRGRGARIAVDDAGEGYAGLQQVMSMRADIIKLDRALVADVHRDPAKVALIGSLVHFGRSTGAAICAEGIETLEELRLLIHLGVAYGQGWALARAGAPWGRVNGEAARLCRELRSEQIARVVPLRKGA